MMRRVDIPKTRRGRVRPQAGPHYPQAPLRRRQAEPVPPPVEEPQEPVPAGRSKRFWIVLASVTLAVVLSTAGLAYRWLISPVEASVPPRFCPPPVSQRTVGNMVRLPGGIFRMGDPMAAVADEQPVHEVVLQPFYIDEHEVTNRQFGQFVAQTGYRTTAERRGWSHLYDRSSDTWCKREGADWRHPGGRATTLEGREIFPVVHVSWYDAMAYARWAGKHLPTEAQWEYAARSGLRDTVFPWGNEELVNGQYQANYRQHGQAVDADGFQMAAPVKSYPPSRSGLYDMSGNAWEWCADWYAGDYYRYSPQEHPQGPPKGYQRVVRGGSFLSPENFRPGHHVSTRWQRTPDFTSQHLGFRCVR